MGKRQIGQMQPFELVLTLIIADLATIPMAEVSVPVLHGVIPLLTLSVLHFIITLVTKLSSTFSRVISGKPVIIINPKGLDYKAMKQLNLSTDDILAALRTCGYFSVAQVQYAIMETNGKVSVMPKAEYSPATNGALELEEQESFLPITLISEGKVMTENMKVAGLEEQEVLDIIVQNGGKKIKEVLLLTIDLAGEAYMQLMSGEGKSFKSEGLR
ncbi:MAG: DUF421 domain-containing protein [Acetobacter sp.]|nr:DUF421 domain-containing protein [Acetobacter sp.]